jgi:hypothetical protein
MCECWTVQAGPPWVPDMRAQVRAHVATVRGVCLAGREGWDAVRVLWVWHDKGSDSVSVRRALRFRAAGAAAAP